MLSPCRSNTCVMMLFFASFARYSMHHCPVGIVPIIRVVGSGLCARPLLSFSGMSGHGDPDLQSLKEMFGGKPVIS